MSPELVKRLPYNGAKADVWALGVILYLMLVGVLPFRAPNEQELFRLIASGKLRYRDETAASPPAKKLIARMVALSPEQRPPLEELLLDPWVRAEQ
jgi:5'-AMP-activated protein kinase catalytic alpha subunit